MSISKCVWLMTLFMLLTGSSHAQPKAGTLKIKPYTGPPIVYLAGGPGGSGIGTATAARFPLFMAFREIADVIAFDQRGTGNSKPNLNCYERLSLPLDVVPSRKAALEELRINTRGCASYWRDLQRVDLTGYNTNESADDLEDLRKALGANQISLWSISYGTHLAPARAAGDGHEGRRAADEVCTMKTVWFC